MNIGITGADGFLGWHLRALLYGNTDDTAVPCDQAGFEQGDALRRMVASSDAIIHLAGINRGTDEEVERGNVAITDKFIGTLEESGRTPHVLFASSVQSERDNPYGRAKRVCAEHLQAWADRSGAKYTTVILPNIFGEFGRPHYNSAVATFCDQLTKGEEPTIYTDAPLELIHVQDVVRRFVELAHAGTTGTIRVQGHTLLFVSDVLARLRCLHASYEHGVFPPMADPFDLQLFNTLRSFQYPEGTSGTFDLHTDARGSLWDVAKAQGAGQTFVSWTLPGITRGNHYHRHKVERFAVLSGQGCIRLRRLLTNEVHTFDFSGEYPGYVDMPTFCTHSIENVGTVPLLTLFWSGELFDPRDPDTYPEPVLLSEVTL
jgi:UDP-2-acetamido-2,6-beta-L-arabino-hexul-4-ose reductase